jgi:hypothetical protein
MFGVLGSKGVNYIYDPSIHRINSSTYKSWWKMHVLILLDLVSCGLCGSVVNARISVDVGSMENDVIRVKENEIHLFSPLFSSVV